MILVINLDDRLSAIADLLGKRQTVADIGTDHGLLGAHLLLSGQCEHVQFLDVSADSLSKARELVEKAGLSERSSFSVGDGTHAMTGAADGVVIAGMGGQLIADIIGAGLDRLSGARLVLQPNVAQMELRTRLVNSGFAIVDERLVKAGRRYYIVIAAVAGAACYSPEELLIGPVLLRDKPKLLHEYAKRQLRIAQKAVAGARQGNAIWLDQLEFEWRTWEAFIDEAEGI